MAQKADDGKVVCRPEGDPANGPYRHYIEDQAEQDRKARFIGDEEFHRLAHERCWENDELVRLHRNDPALVELVVKAFYTGRASASRERPHGRRMVSEALNDCHRRYQKAAAEAFAQIMSSRGKG